MSQVIKIALKNINKGLKIKGFHISNILKNNGYKGIFNHDLNSKKIQIDEITKIIKKQNFQNIYQ